MAHNGVAVKGGATAETDLGETLVIEFESGCLSHGKFGLDSLYGNFNEGSVPDARVVYTAFNNGV